MGRLHKNTVMEQILLFSEHPDSIFLGMIGEDFYIFSHLLSAAHNVLEIEQSNHCKINTPPFTNGSANLPHLNGTIRDISLF